MGPCRIVAGECSQALENAPDFYADIDPVALTQESKKAESSYQDPTLQSSIHCILGATVVGAGKPLAAKGQRQAL